MTGMSSNTKRARPVSVDNSVNAGVLPQALSRSSKKARKDLDTGSGESSNETADSILSVGQTTEEAVSGEALATSVKGAPTQHIPADGGDTNVSIPEPKTATVTGEKDRSEAVSVHTISDEEDSDDEAARDVNALPDRLDLYGPQNTAGLQATFKPPGDKRDQRLAETYRQAIKYRARNPGPANANLNFEDGELQWSQCAEPFGDGPYRITVSEVSSDVDVRLGTHEEKMKVYQMKLELDDDGCFGDSGEGKMRVRKAWQGNTGEALYECHAEIDVEYSPMTQGKGHGPGEEYSAIFWGIEAKESEEGSS